MVASFVLAAGLPDAALADHDEGRILIYTGTTGVRHAGGTGANTQAISAPAVEALGDALENAGYEYDWVDCNGAGTAAGQCQNPSINPAVFTADGLAEYDAIILFNATSATANPLWTTAQRDAIRGWVQDGHGIAAVHASVDMANGSESWSWWDGGNESAVGARVSSRTGANTVANIQIADGAHFSTKGLPDSFELEDEHYTFNSNVRGRAHVLATRNPNAPESTNQVSADNPISWCKPYDGGRVWVTGMGHFESAFTANGGNNNLVKHVVGGARWAAGDGTEGMCGGTIWTNYNRTVLAMTNGPIGLDVTDDGRVYWTEIGTTGNSGVGKVKMYDPTEEEVFEVAQIETRTGQGEDGLLGMALAPDFNETRHIYMYYSPRIPGGLPSGVTFDENISSNILSRFTISEDGKSFEPNSEQQILRVPMAKFNGGDTWLCSGPGHIGGASVVFDSEGSLYIGIGDDVDPNCGASGANGGAPIDQRFPQRYDARNTSANTNDLRGAILRIKPKPDASGTPGVGNTYEIPEGNLFPPGTPLTRPELYAKGFRQPFTVSVDPANPGTVVMAEYGPDGTPQDEFGNARGPNRPIEWNYIRSAGFYGWPYCTGDNSTANSYARWVHPSGPSGPRFDCNQSEIPNESDFNTGQPSMPGPARKAAFYISGSSPITGPIYRYDQTSQSATRWPEYFDGAWLHFERSSFFREARIRRDNRDILRYNTMFPFNHFGSPAMSHPIPARFGPDGSLYMAVWANSCCRGAESTATALMRIDYTANEVTADTIPPTASHELTGNKQGNAYINHATLKLSGKDNYAGGGLDRLEYSTNGGNTWTTYEDPVSFGPGNHVVLYRAVDKFDNMSEPVELPITVVEVPDYDPPEVDHQVNGTLNQYEQYLTGVTVSFTASDVLSGVASIEYRIGNGPWEVWDGEALKFNDAGHYVIRYRATDTAPVPNTSEVKIVEFSAVPACLHDYSDEFNGDTLSPKWDYKHPTTLDEDISIGGGYLTMKTGLSEIDNSANGPANFIGTPLPPGEEWSATVKVTIDHQESWQTAGLLIYQSDVNVLRVSYTHNNSSPGNTFFETQRDDPPGGGRTGGGSAGSGANNPDTALIRVTRSGNNLTAYYSWDVDSPTPTWNAIGMPNGGFPFDTDPRRDGPDVRIGPLAGGNMGGGPKIDAKFDWFRVELPGASEHCEALDVRPPVAGHVVEPGVPDGGDGWYRTPPVVNLAATDDFTEPDEVTIEYRLGSGGNWQTYSAPLVISNTGPTEIHYRATDNAGNTSDEAIIELKLDNVAPTVTVQPSPESPDSPQGGWNIGSSFAASADDQLSGVAGLEYSIGNDGWNHLNMANPPKLDSPGTYTVRVRATDVAGNTSDPVSTVITIDPPILDALTGVGTLTVDLPGPDYAGPAVARTMFRVTRAGLPVTGTFLEMTDPLVLNVPGEYVLQYFHEYQGGGNSPVFTRPMAVVAPASLTWTTKPKKLKLKKGKRKVVTITIRNRGGVDSAPTKLCVKAPKKRVKAPKCAPVPWMAPEAIRKVKLGLKGGPKIGRVAKTKVKIVLRGKEAWPPSRTVTVRR